VIRYRYNQQINPPAPFIHVALQRLDGAATIADLPAQLDTAADSTVVPATLIEELGLVPFGTVQVLGFGGDRLAFCCAAGFFRSCDRPFTS